jgi:bifunctional pyridoxal-dependent enzyme with beta-cystathionase and maltose regulon repressor activities
MQQYDFDKYIERAGTQSVKWDRYPKDGGYGLSLTSLGTF